MNGQAHEVKIRVLGNLLSLGSQLATQVVLCLKAAQLRRNCAQPSNLYYLKNVYVFVTLLIPKKGGHSINFQLYGSKIFCSNKMSIMYV